MRYSVPVMPADSSAGKRLTGGPGSGNNRGKSATLAAQNLDEYVGVAESDGEWPKTNCNFDARRLVMRANRA